TLCLSPDRAGKETQKREAGRRKTGRGRKGHRMTRTFAHAIAQFDEISRFEHRANRPGEGDESDEDQLETFEATAPKRAIDHEVDRRSIDEHVEYGGAGMK